VTKPRDADPPRDRADSHRKPYRTPKLEPLGTLTEITANTATAGKNDHNGHAPFNKTA
jgi:hypothetical protein